MKDLFAVLDLFSATGSATDAFRRRGYPVDTLDKDGSFNPTFQRDINEIESIHHLGIHRQIGYSLVRYHYIHASFPCETYSVASIGTHWMGGKEAYIPKTPEAKLSIRTVFHTLQLIEEYRPPKVSIENPVSVFRKVWGPILMGLGYVRRTIWQCQYGAVVGVRRAKPTDFFIRGFDFEAKICHNGAKDHEEAHRGAKTGTQGLKPVERARFPIELSEAIFQGVIKA